MVAAVVSRDTDGRISRSRLAVGSCSASAQRPPALEQALIGTPGALRAITEGHLAPRSPIDDIRGTAAYRRHTVGVLLRRAIAA